MDTIFIENLRFTGKHGVYKKERSKEQEFQISLSLEVDTKNSQISDKLSDTIDYQKIKDTVQGMLEKTSHYLIERLAREIADSILKDKRIKSAEVTIRKLTVWENGVPGVTIKRSNS